MVINNNIKFDFDDILVVPNSITEIDSRYQNLNPYYQGRLPLFTAPMDTVVDEHTMKLFAENKINIVLPRTVKYKKYNQVFNSFSLSEFEDEIEKMSPMDGEWRVLIDVANGHMGKIIQWCKLAKEKNPNIIIMAGNIANPETYKLYCESGAIDYARIGIGNGNGCLTTQQTGIGYPMGSLISECNEIKQKFENPTKIVADGGMKKYSDIIRALALGADYVMIGSIFNKAFESASPNYWNGIKLPKFIATWMFKRGYKLYKEYRGMSTKKSQILMGNTKIRTSEGVIKKQFIEYTIQQWTENLEHYLRSSMSYANSMKLEDYIGKVKIIFITQNANNRYNK